MIVDFHEEGQVEEERKLDVMAPPEIVIKVEEKSKTTAVVAEVVGEPEKTPEVAAVV
jgi:hypothetical protein